MFHYPFQMHLCRAKTTRRQKVGAIADTDAPRVFAVGFLEKPSRSVRPTIGDDGVAFAAIGFDVQLDAFELSIGIEC